MPESVTLEVKVNLDDVPGAFHTKESAAVIIAAILNNQIPHYHPRVFIPVAKK